MCLRLPESYSCGGGENIGEASFQLDCFGYAPETFQCGDSNGNSIDSGVIDLVSGVGGCTDPSAIQNYN
jgi:hypothetical protein